VVAQATRRLIGLLALAVGLGAAAIPVRAEEKVQHTEEVPYSDPAIGTAGIGICFQGDSCVMVEPEEQDRYATVDIVDSLGLPVYASIIQDTSGDGSWLATDDYTVHICGRTTGPIEIKPGKTVTVWVWEGPGLDPPCAGVATSGVVKITLSNLP
jgi:hypothetical protein